MTHRHSNKVSGGCTTRTSPFGGTIASKDERFKRIVPKLWAVKICGMMHDGEGMEDHRWKIQASYNSQS